MFLSRRQWLGSLAALGLLPSRLVAQQTGTQAVSPASGPMTAAALTMLRRAAGTPGMVVFWQRGQDRQAILADGLRAAGHAQAVSPADKWHIGSITKSFTATLFARAVEAGAIGWDTPLGAVLANVPRRHRKLTGIDLLSHHAGLAKDIPLPALFAMPQQEADARASRARYAELALAMPRAGKPRRDFLYSNAGYVLAAHMLEAVSNLPFEVLLRREVLIPLGLGSAGFGPPGSQASHEQPWGHDGGVPVFADNPAAMAPAGGLHLAAADLLTYLAAHRDRAPLLRPESWAQLHRPRFGSQMALGWFVDPDGSLWHNGSNTRWYAEVLIDRGADAVMGHCGNDMALFHRQRLLLPLLRSAAAAVPDQRTEERR
ncbi:MAG: serine hydrolase domain-containing protein [Novosphingobium sp.]